MAFMSDVPTSLKAISMGIITIVLIGFGYSFVSAPLETFIAQQFFAQPESREELIQSFIWPGTVVISMGALIAFAGGGFVIARMSERRPLLSALVPVLIFIGLVWAPVIIRGYTNHLTPTIYSLVSWLAAVAGGVLGLRAASGSKIDTAVD